MPIVQDHWKLGFYAEVFALESGALMPTIDQSSITYLKLFISDRSKIYLRFLVLFPMRMSSTVTLYRKIILT